MSITPGRLQRRYERAMNCRLIVAAIWAVPLTRRNALIEVARAVEDWSASKPGESAIVDLPDDLMPMADEIESKLTAALGIHLSCRTGARFAIEAARPPARQLIAADGRGKSHMAPITFHAATATFRTTAPTLRNGAWVVSCLPLDAGMNIRWSEKVYVLVWRTP